MDFKTYVQAVINAQEIGGKTSKQPLDHYHAIIGLLQLLRALDSNDAVSLNAIKRTASDLIDAIQLRLDTERASDKKSKRQVRYLLTQIDVIKATVDSYIAVTPE